MRLITAIIKPHKWAEVREALATAGIAGLTLTEASGYGNQKGHSEIYRGAEFDVKLVPKLRLEIIVDDADADMVVSTITSAAQTGKIGDGKVWVVPVESIVRVRTGETGEAAL